MHVDSWRVAMVVHHTRKASKELCTCQCAAVPLLTGLFGNVDTIYKAGKQARTCAHVSVQLYMCSQSACGIGDTLDKVSK